MVELEAIKDRASRELIRVFGGLQSTEAGFVVRLEKTELHVDFFEFPYKADESPGDGPRIHILFTTVILRDCKKTPELCEWAATGPKEFFLGGPLVWERDDGKFDLIVHQELIGDTIDPLVINTTVTFMVGAAAMAADDLQKRFGGHLVSAERGDE